jgi:hypothetical protein
MNDLLSVFLRVREAIARPENDFLWSSWRDAAHALEEIDDIIATLRAGQMPDRLQMSVFFAPTGPIQEVCLSSGWGDEFIVLADAFDAAMER